jgi:hypothetical protein
MTRLATILALTAAPVFAQNQTVCASYDDFTAALASRYGEQRQWTALERRGGLMEGWANLETGSWTIIVIGPDLRSCLVAAGPHYERIDETPGEPS